jgi:effector-binding domain-containing protein
LIEEPQIVQTAPQQVAILHIDTPRARMQQVMGPAISELMAAVRAQGVGPTGPWFAHHLKMNASDFDLDVCVPVSAPVAAVGRVTPGERPALQVVRTVYHGPYEGLGDAWGEFTRWIQAHGHATAGDLYETYLSGPESGADPAGWRTELSRALVPAADRPR